MNFYVCVSFATLIGINDYIVLSVSLGTSPFLLLQDFLQSQTLYRLNILNLKCSVIRMF